MALAIAAAVWYFWNSNGLEEKVAHDNIERYEIAKKGQDKVEICMYAGLVAGAFNQAKDEKSYLHWKEIERSDCATAGLKK